MRCFLALPLLVACGGYGSAFRADTTLAEVTCERAFACASSFPDEATTSFADAYGSDVDGCVTRVGPDPADRDAWDAAEDDGRLVYDDGAARACAEALQAADCETFWSTRGGEACAATFTGTLDRDATCAIDETCASGACRDGYCD